MLAKKNGNKEIEAKAISEFLNCFKPSSKSLSCLRGNIGITLTDYPKEIRKEFYRRLTIELKDTEYGKKQKYWY
jgi:hypothetical protein